MSNLFPFNCGTWNNIIPQFSITYKLGDNLKILNARMDPECRKTLGRTRINFRSTVNASQWSMLVMVNSNQQSTLVNSNPGWFSLVRLGSTWIISVSQLSFKTETSGGECRRFRTLIGLIFTVSRSSHRDLRFDMWLYIVSNTSSNTTLLENLKNKTEILLEKAQKHYKNNSHTLHKLLLEVILLLLLSSSYTWCIQHKWHRYL